MKHTILFALLYAALSQIHKNNIDNTLSQSNDIIFDSMQKKSKTINTQNNNLLLQPPDDIKKKAIEQRQKQTKQLNSQINDSNISKNKTNISVDKLKSNTDNSFSKTLNKSKLLFNSNKIQTLNFGQLKQSNKVVVNYPPEISNEKKNKPLKKQQLSHLNQQIKIFVKAVSKANQIANDSHKQYEIINSTNK